jgi:hypothetical protein
MLLSQRSVPFLLFCHLYPYLTHVYRPLSRNGPKNNDKAMECLVEPIGILVLNEVLFAEEREAHLRASIQSACRARRILLATLIVIFGSVPTQEPNRRRQSVLSDHFACCELLLLLSLIGLLRQFVA